MGNAVWLFQALPEWYFSAAAHPLNAGLLSAVPALGTVLLAVGLALGLVARKPRLLLFLVPFALSQFFVAVAGGLRGQLQGTSSTLPQLLFIAVQIVLVTYLIYCVAGARQAAVALAAFSLTYVFFGKLYRSDVVQQHLVMKSAKGRLYRTNLGVARQPRYCRMCHAVVRAISDRLSPA